MSDFNENSSRPGGKAGFDLPPPVQGSTFLGIIRRELGQKDFDQFAALVSGVRAETLSLDTVGQLLLVQNRFTAPEITEFRLAAHRHIKGDALPKPGQLAQAELQAPIEPRPQPQGGYLTARF
jgi:hypothetical protein